MVIKEGMLYKKGGGNGILQRKNWKQRYVRLTSSAIEYYCTSSGQLKGSVQLAECTPKALEIMPLDCPKTGMSGSSIWRLSIQTPTRRLYLAAETEDEMHAWAFTLIDIFQANETLRHNIVGKSC